MAQYELSPELMDRFVNSSVPLGDPAGAPLSSVVDGFVQAIREAGLDFGVDERELAASFIAALATKPFVIFSGLSGSGKTKLATALGQWFGRDRLLVQPVRPDWTSPEAVLGCENPNLDTRDSMLAWNVPRVLEFLLNALNHPDDPYLLVLDEMNLAHVEQYFADVLSGMESKQPVVPNLRFDGTGWRQNSEVGFLPWPSNLFLVGTVNLDETTYKFSPKVLDRATSIEFRVLSDALRTSYPAEDVVTKGDRELLSAMVLKATMPEPSWNKREHLAGALRSLHGLLYEYDAEFGHRVFRESLRFGSLCNDAGLGDLKTILDMIVLYKVLPKFPMTKPSDRAFLESLAGLALYGPGRLERVNPLDEQIQKPMLPRTFAKLERIARANA